MRYLLPAMVVLLPTLAIVDKRDDEREAKMSAMGVEMLRSARTTPMKPASLRDFAKAWRAGMATLTKTACACRDRWTTDPTEKNHCINDASLDLMRGLMPVILRVPGKLEAIEAAEKRSKAEASAATETLVAEMMKKAVPAKEQKAAMSRLLTCVGN
ncbi:MAG: hypothetical protein JWP01_1480 [Myxococcales bacterium]|nr:hypothetical protein [Myxococcales bacterium]